MRKFLFRTDPGPYRKSSQVGISNGWTMFAHEALPMNKIQIDLIVHAYHKMLAYTNRKYAVEEVK